MLRLRVLDKGIHVIQIQAENSTKSKLIFF